MSKRKPTCTEYFKLDFHHNDDKPLSEVLKFYRECAATIKARGGYNLRMLRGQFIQYTRAETAEETKRRLKEDALRATKIEKEERDQYARLKAKFEKKESSGT